MVRQTRFRALITLDQPGMQEVPTTRPFRPPAREYENYTHSLVIRCPGLQDPASIRYFSAEICWDDEQPLHPGDHAKVTITLTDDEALEFLGPGQHIDLWCGGSVGHGTISRRVYTEHGPS